LRRLIERHDDLPIHAGRRGRNANDIDHYHGSARSEQSRPDT